MNQESSVDTIEFQFPFANVQQHKEKSLSSSVRIDFGCATHVGKVRPNNEDSFVVFKAARVWDRLYTNLNPEDLPDRWEEDSYGMAVADGMGGAAAGEVASRMAIQICVRCILQSPRWAIKLDNPETRDEEIEASKQRAEKYLHQIDEEMAREATFQPALKGMGTTFTGAYSNGSDLFIVHTGDSRAYLMRQNRLMQLTNDQTVAQELVRMGSLTTEQARKHYLRHTLTSCLGCNGQIQLDIFHERLLNGDRLLLCTDGLNDMINDSQIAEILLRNEPSQLMANRLVDTALNAGGKDNITVVVAAYAIP